MIPTSAAEDVRGGPRSILGSGWIPAALVLLVAVCLLRGAAEVGLRDQVFFAGYVLGWVVLPGTIIWRLVDRRPRRPLVEDLALGSLVGYVVEFPIYLGCLAVGHPRWYLLWPLVVLGLALGTPRGRTLLHRGGPRMSTAWSWSVAGLLTYTLIWFARNIWGPTPAAGPNLRSPYVDEPYHLSLIAGLKHFSPARVLYVKDTPLDYHYLSHVHMAAASWVSTVEPIVILRSLAMPVLVMLVLLALAVAAARLSNRTWLGPAALAGILVGPANFSAGSNGSGVGFLDVHFYTSPSAAFTNAGLLLGIVMVIELLRRENGGIGFWGLSALAMVAMCGAKASSLPTVVAGLFLATVVASLATRRIAVRPLMLTALAGFAFLAARWLFFGPNSQGLAWDPLGYVGRTAQAFPGLSGADREPSFAVSAVIALSILSVVTLAAGVLAGLGAGGWREPDTVFLVGLCAAGYGAALAFHQIGYSERYFIIAVQLPLILGAALGIARHGDALAELGRGLGVRGGRNLALLAVAAGFAAGLFYTVVNRPIGASSINGSPLAQAWQLFAIPILIVLLGASAITAGVVAFARRRASTSASDLGRSAAPRPHAAASVAIAALVFAGIGLSPTFHRVKALTGDPVPAPVAYSPRLIGEGGITAARYLRRHAPLGTVVATNAHCARPSGAVCIPRNFWMAGYAERQFLVEGWSYVSRASVGLPAPRLEDIVSAPFWDPQRLADNDAALLTPTTANLRRLKQRYGVQWILIDERFPSNIQELGRVADRRLAVGRYVVFELR